MDPFCSIESFGQIRDETVAETMVVIALLMAYGTEKHLCSLYYSDMIENRSLSTRTYGHSLIGYWLGPLRP